MTAHTKIRTFATGANRDTEAGKLDYEGFLSPLVLERFAQYMHKNRALPDGSLRDSDNWQKGIPLDVYMKSLWRHFHETWKTYRGTQWDNRFDDQSGRIEEALCGVLFNAMGYLHEHLKTRAMMARGCSQIDRAPVPWWRDRTMDAWEPKQRMSGDEKVNDDLHTDYDSSGHGEGQL